jgi:glycosyltransferase involved in cell wall biosynthesis
MPRASVVICTHDRAALLEAAIQRVLPQVEAADAELLVVDNASTDGTAGILARLARTTPERLRVVQEPRLGLSAARNRGLRSARGTVAAFLDDDARPRPGWLAALLAPYAEPRVVGTGGPIMPAYPGPPPAWMRPPMATVLGAHDLGSTTRPYPSGLFPHGGNMSFRVDAASAAGGFSLEMGLRGTTQRGHEETDLACRLVRGGGILVYAADAIVDHDVFPERLRPAWLLERQRSNGESSALFVLRNFGARRALGWLRWHHRTHLLNRPYVPADPIDADRLLAEFHRREAVGYVRGLVRGLLRRRRDTTGIAY